MMAKNDELFMGRKSLGEICTTPEKIISVYSLEKHVWSDSNDLKSRRARKPELQTIDEFQIDPVRPFLNDILRNISAPYDAARKENPVGQGYWIQAEFGSGKSHLLCCLSALALGSKDAWELVRKKEEKSGKGKRESLYRFWEDGLEAKNSKGKKGVLVVVKTLVGVGSGTVGVAGDKGRPLSEYILDAIKEQLQAETGKNLSLYPVERLADRFVNDDLDRYRNDLKKFLKSPQFFHEDEFEEVDQFIKDIQANKSPEYKRSCGNKLWRFYTEFLKVQPHIPAEPEEILKHAVETVLSEGYAGILLVLDEVSLFMKNRDESQRTDDEKTLVVLANRLAKVMNLPVWLVCSAQQAIESKLGVKNIIADDRLKLVKLLENDADYYQIVLSRVRQITDPSAIAPYFMHYKKGFSWPQSIGQSDFTHFFPFHKPALEVLRSITPLLTEARSAIHFMHQTLKRQIKQEGKELIRLWELFDETVQYEEDPSGTHAGLVAIKTKMDTDYKAYEASRRQIDAMTKGLLKVHRDKSIKVVQTLFLYHIGRTRLQGLTPDEIANSVLIERQPDSNIDENVQHYETIAEALKKELRQIAQNFDEDKKPRYRFDPVFSGLDPRGEFSKAKNEAEANEQMRKEAWDHLLALDEWPVKTRQMTMDLSNGIRSIFRDVAPSVGSWKSEPLMGGGEFDLEVTWLGRQVTGFVSMRDLAKTVADNLRLPPIESDRTDRDFALFVSSRPAESKHIVSLLARYKDPRAIFWTPDTLRTEETDRLIEFAAYRKLVNDWSGKDTEDAVTIINWVANALRTDLGRIYQIVPDSYRRGRMDAQNNSEMEFQVAGELPAIISPLVEKVLSTAYESREIRFDGPYVFKKEEGIKVINGIVKRGEIPKGEKPNQNVSAAQNFGFGLRIMKKSAERKLDISGNAFVDAIWSFIEEKLPDDGQQMKADTLYKNFMGVGGPKDFGLTRRMIQIYLLCLAREGKLRIGLSPKSGLSTDQLDYSNLAEIEFSAKVIDSFLDVQRLKRPENWEVLRPYAEKLLQDELPSTHDDSVIAGYRKKLKECFTSGRELAEKVTREAADLFASIKMENPYSTELKQADTLFHTDLASGDDIALILHGLKEAYGYKAYDDERSTPSEVDDLANRLKNYRDIEQFLAYQSEIRAAVAYCSHSLPDIPELKAARAAQQVVATKLKDIRQWIDSPVRLKTELIGHTPATAGESGTLGKLITEYSTAYTVLHDQTIEQIVDASTAIQDLVGNDRFALLERCEGISALKPGVSDSLRGAAQTAIDGLFGCADPSQASIERELRRHPHHVCGLSFENASEHVQAATDAHGAIRQRVNEAIRSKYSIFLAAPVRELLQQGKKEAVISELLGCDTVEAVEAVLAKHVVPKGSAVEVINRYLKTIVVTKVRVSDFKPSTTTVEPDGVAAVAEEFRGFLAANFGKSKGKDVIEVLQLE
jgi:hypothetical protein